MGNSHFLGDSKLLNVQVDEISAFVCVYFEGGNDGSSCVLCTGAHKGESLG